MILYKNLCNDIKNYIFSYIPYQYLIPLNKKYYKKYHYLLEKKISEREIHSYIRFIIRMDCYLAMSCIIEHIYNSKDKKNKKIYIYKNIKTSYINHMNELCIKYKSNNCRNIIRPFLKKK